VDDSGTLLFVVLFVDPGRFESGERSESGYALPDGVIAIGRSDNSDIRTGVGGFVNELLLKSVGHAFIHRGTTRQDDVLAEFFSDVNIGGRDGSPGEGLESLVRRVVSCSEHDLWGSDTDTAGNGDLLVVGKVVIIIRNGILFVLFSTLGALFFLGSEILGKVADFFLHLVDNFGLVLAVAGILVTLILQELHKVLRDATTGDP